MTVGLAVLCAAVVGASLMLESRALDQARRDAVDRAVVYVDDVITPLVAERSSSGPFSSVESASLLALIGKRIRDDDVARVRLWSTDGELLFSTDDGDASRNPAPETVMIAGRGDGSVKSAIGSDKDGSRRVLETFVPVPSGGDPAVAVGQVDQRYRPIEAEGQGIWGSVRVAAGAGTALFVAMLLLSMARGARAGPAGATGFGSPGSERSARKQPREPDTGKTAKKLEKSEAARSALEEQLEQLRTQVAGAGSRAVEQQAEFEAQLARSQDRVKELEELVRETEARVVPSQRAAEFDDEPLRSPVDADRIAELERELAELRTELERSRSRLQELEPLVAESAARVEDAESRADRGARAADVRAREAEARADEQERQLHVALARVSEQEAFIRDAEQRLAASASAAEQAALRVRELEGKMDGARHDAQAATERAEGAEALLAESAATDQDAVGRAQEAERRAEEEGRRAEGLQARVDEMQAHMTQLEELVRAAEERAATDRFEMDETLREKQALEAKLEAAQATFEERAGDGSERTAELERQLKEAHEAGKRAIRAAGEARAELELARGELAVAEARVTEAEALAYAEADAARAEVALERQLGEVEGSGPSIGVEAEPNGRRREPAASEAEANGHDTDDEPDEEELDDEGPSLRFRLARTAANKKGKVADRESMWS